MIVTPLDPPGGLPDRRQIGVRHGGKIGVGYGGKIGVRYGGKIGVR